MTVTQIEGKTISVPVFRASDGREFVPDLSAHYNIQAAIDTAKSSAEGYEKCLKEKAEMVECARRLFGDKADAVLSVLWNDRMRYFCRRIEVLKSIDKEIAKLSA